MSKYPLCPEPQGDEGQNPAPGSLLVQQFIFTFAKALEECLAVDGLHPAALHVVVTVVEHFARFRKLCDASGHGVLQQLVGRTSGFDYELVNPGLQIRGEMSFHALQGTRKPAVRPIQEAKAYEIVCQPGHLVDAAVKSQDYRLAGLAFLLISENARISVSRCTFAPRRNILVRPAQKT